MRKVFFMLSVMLSVYSVVHAIGISTLGNIKGAYMDLSGRTHKVADHKGNVLLLNFWAGWCAPCLAEVPRLNAIYAKYSAQGFSIIALSVDQMDLPQIRSEVKSLRMQFPVGRAEKELLEEVGISQIPVSFLFDRDGNLLRKYIGIPPGDTMTFDIEKALASGSKKK